MKPVYRDGTTADEIVVDGWARGFRITQTMDELNAQGYAVPIEDVERRWAELDKELEVNNV